MECKIKFGIRRLWTFLIYFSVFQISKKESWFYVNVHTISLCIVFSKSSLNPKFTILPWRSVCRTPDEFYHPNILGFLTAFGYYSLSDRAKKSYFFPGDKSWKVYSSTLICILTLCCAYFSHKLCLEINCTMQLDQQFPNMCFLSRNCGSII